MPKATKARTKSSRTAPIPSEKPIKKATEQPTTKPRDPTHSHLYTDDNPSTTIHGTGFKDAAAAHRTLDLISKRSMTYQFQTVNTMYHRAKHHPAMKKKGSDEAESTADMRAAMDVFKNWLDVTYPEAKAAMRGGGGFKPLLSKKIVERYIPQIEESSEVDEDAKTFAKTYVELGKGKRLGNVLVDDSKPAEPDWEAKRYSALCKLVPEGKEDAGSWELDELWSGDEKATGRHLKLTAWAWSPVPERKLP